MVTSADVLGNWRRVTKSEPCPICSKPDWCSVGDLVIHCMRVESNKPAHGDGGGWMHARPDAHSRNGHTATPKKDREKPTIDWAAMAQRLASEITDKQVQTLADELGVTATSLRELGIGYGLVPGGVIKGRGTFGVTNYTFPMHDASGAVNGLRRRDPKTGEKFAITGSSLGVIRRQKPDDGQLLICEGESDTAAALVLGFDAIGRPGVTTCAEIAAAYARGRDVVVVADNDDPKDPKKLAAIKGVHNLVKKLVASAKSVRVIHPPAEHKDLRAWRQAGATREDIEAAIAAAPIVNEHDIAERDAIQNENVGGAEPAAPSVCLEIVRTLPTAERFLQDHYSHAEGRTLQVHAGSFWAWRGNRYALTEDAQIRHQLQPWLHRAIYMKIDEDGNVKRVPFPANSKTITSALDAVRDLVLLPADLQPPAWLGEGDPPAPLSELLFHNSGTLHIPTGTTLLPTPRIFATNALDFDYNANAPRPTRWHVFLQELFGDDVESINLLREWFGYCLTADTSLHKMLMQVGPKRSGKSTIARVQRKLVGIANCVSPTTSSLAGPFGLQPLIGKSLAIVSDARFAGPDIQIVSELLLGISGEDAPTIARKFMDAITMKLPTRFMILTNELPRFSDSSNALPSRFLLLKLTKSFYNSENVNLTNELLAELPGILLWAIEGWHRLHERGRFVEPESSRLAMQDMADLSSPVGAFLRQRCIVEPGHRTPCKRLYAAWKGWCEADGRTSCTTVTTFGKDLAAAAPGIKRREGSDREFYYEGVALK